MQQAIEPYDQAYSHREYRSNKVRLYVIDKQSLEKVRVEPDGTRSVFESQATIDQWKGWLGREGIYKNLNKEEAVYIKRMFNKTNSPSGWGCLVIAGDELLLSNKEVDKTYARLPHPEAILEEPARRSLFFIPLPSEFTVLDEPGDFRNIQRLLFDTRVHFESSFDAEIWAPDNRGLHARSSDMCQELANLSDLHNMFADALRHFKSGSDARGWALIRTAFQLSDTVVQTHHHRLIPDILGIILLLQQSSVAVNPGLSRLPALLRRHLVLWSESNLATNDPRRLFFEALIKVPLKWIYHLYLTFDAYCRHIWDSRIGGDEIRSYYTYNQASFPRAEQGRFYSLFEGKSVPHIHNILSTADSQFGLYTTEAFCMWHTALQYLFSTGQHEVMLHVSRTLCVRLDRFRIRWDHNQSQQLNHDAAMSFYLLGEAEEAMGNSMNALEAFRQSVSLRTQVVPHGEWDPAKRVALGRLETIASRVGDGTGVMFYEALLAAMYSELEANDLEEITNAPVAT